MGTQVVKQLPKTTYAQRRREEKRAARRETLQTAQYIRRLHETAEKAATADPADIPAMALQCRIWFGLLAKCLPDLKAVEVTGDGSIQTVVFVPVTAASAEEWAAQVRVEQERRVLPGVLIEQQPTDEG